LIPSGPVALPIRGKKSQQSKVGHLELELHIFFEPHDLIRRGPCDDQVININVDDEPGTSLVSPAVDGMLVLTLKETQLDQSSIQLLIPRP
jgi:hypothetical protein